MGHGREATGEDRAALAQRCGALFYTETSALSGEGIEPPFLRLLEFVVMQKEPGIARLGERRHLPLSKESFVRRNLTQEGATSRFTLVITS
jgi:hypothetical protein